MCIAYGGKIRIQPPGVWQISYTFHRPTNKLEGTISVALYIPLVTFDINEGRGDSFGIDGALGPVLLSGVGWCSGCRG